ALAAGLVGTVTQARRATRQAARADLEALQARAQRDFALQQLARSEATNDLDAFLLRDAAPGGKPFTVGALLDRAEVIVGRQPDDRTRAGMRIQVGRQYLLLEQDAKGRAVLGKAYDDARRVADPALRAEAACELAWGVALGGEQARGEQLFQEAMALIPADPLYAPLRVECLLSGSAVAHEADDTPKGLARAQAAHLLLEKSRFASAPLELSVLTQLGESYRLRGDYREADAAFKEAFARLVVLGRDRTDTAAGVLMSWGLSVRGLGQTLAAERLFRQSIEIRTAGGGDDLAGAMLLANMARVLRELERFPEAMRFAERAHATGRRTGQEVAINQSLLVMVALRRQQGDLAGARRTADELEGRFQRLLPKTDLQFASLAMERAQ
ncbi:MAG TPA: tetratricopeptide repeat protein, partial [Planctomycetota bacterium]|nr:tetratricopeptide repeat protein [Planctomycetota bacterium]